MVNAHISRSKRRIRTRQLLPPIQIGTTGDPISVVDIVAQAVVTAVILALLARWLGAEFLM